MPTLTPPRDVVSFPAAPQSLEAAGLPLDLMEAACNSYFVHDRQEPVVYG